MNYSMLLVGILPLIVFVFVDTFGSQKVALIMAILAALGEALFTFFYFGELDSVTLITLFSVTLFAFISVKTKKDIYFKIQPVLMSSLFGIILVGSYLLGVPLLTSMVVKYGHLLPPENQILLTNPTYLKLLSVSTMTCGVAFFCHAILTYIAAVRLSNWSWIAVRGVGFYFFMILGVISANLFI